MAVAHCPSVSTESYHEMANFSASPYDPLICCEPGTLPSACGRDGGKNPFFTLQGKKGMCDYRERGGGGLPHHLTLIPAQLKESRQDMVEDLH